MSTSGFSLHSCYQFEGDFLLMLNEKNDKRFSPNDRIRKVWIPKQRLVHKDELATK